MSADLTDPKNSDLLLEEQKKQNEEDIKNHQENFIKKIIRTKKREEWKIRLDLEKSDIINHYL